MIQYIQTKLQVAGFMLLKGFVGFTYPHIDALVPDYGVSYWHAKALVWVVDIW